MRVLFDIVHPAHVHFFRAMIGEMEDAGGECLVVSRDKDVTIDLLDRFEIRHHPVGVAASASHIDQGRELAVRVSTIARKIADFRPDFVCTRNPSGVLAAKAFPSVLSLFDTDDGAAAGLHYRLGALADVITMPRGLAATRAARTRKYPSYKALAYLHPDRFTPDPGLRDELGVGTEPLFVVRLVAMKASHDHGESGFDPATRTGLVDTLSTRGRLFISSEDELPEELEQYRLPVGPDRLHDVLAAADLYVGDSQTVAAEAGLLGTATVHVSSWSRRLAYLVELEDRYELIRSFKPDDPQILPTVDHLTAEPSATGGVLAERRKRMLSERVDLTGWYVDLLETLV
ncbi:MAG: DUF354 domain-containing protein [Actinomycetia bacterium]|nr:DUF354 domain-containing protein [Actinomycetes bacterium]